MISNSNRRILNNLSATTTRLSHMATTKKVEYFDRCFTEADKEVIQRKLAALDLKSFNSNYLNIKGCYYVASSCCLKTGTSDIPTSKSFSKTKVKKHGVLGPLKQELDSKLQQAYGPGVESKFYLLQSKDRAYTGAWYMAGALPSGIAVDIVGKVAASIEDTAYKKNLARKWKQQVAKELANLNELYTEISKIVPDEE